MINFSCIQDLIDIANAQERTIDDIVVEYEATHSFKSVIYIKEKYANYLASNERVSRKKYK